MYTDELQFQTFHCQHSLRLKLNFSVPYFLWLKNKNKEKFVKNFYFFKRKRNEHQAPCVYTLVPVMFTICGPKILFGNFPCLSLLYNNVMLLFVYIKI